MSKSILSNETKRLVNLSRRVGTRLRNQLIAEERQFAEACSREDSSIPPNTALGLPDKEWLGFAKWYSETVLGLLKEQRTRAQLADKSGLQTLTEDEVNAELERLVDSAVEHMSDEDFERLANQRRIAKAKGAP